MFDVRVLTALQANYRLQIPNIDTQARLKIPIKHASRLRSQGTLHLMLTLRLEVDWQVYFCSTRVIYGIGIHRDFNLSSYFDIIVSLLLWIFTAETHILTKQALSLCFCTGISAVEIHG